MSEARKMRKPGEEWKQNTQSFLVMIDGIIRSLGVSESNTQYFVVNHPTSITTGVAPEALSLNSQYQGSVITLDLSIIDFSGRSLNSV